MCTPLSPVRFMGPKKHKLEQDLQEARQKLNRLDRLCKRLENPPMYEADAFCNKDCPVVEGAFKLGWLRAFRAVREILQ